MRRDPEAPPPLCRDQSHRFGSSRVPLWDQLSFKHSPFVLTFDIVQGTYASRLACCGPLFQTAAVREPRARRSWTGPGPAGAAES